jgi:hypothetical protein
MLEAKLGTEGWDRRHKVGRCRVPPGSHTGSSPLSCYRCGRQAFGNGAAELTFGDAWVSVLF